MYNIESPSLEFIKEIEASIYALEVDGQFGSKLVYDEGDISLWFIEGFVSKVMETNNLAFSKSMQTGRVWDDNLALSWYYRKVNRMVDYIRSRSRQLVYGVLARVFFIACRKLRLSRYFFRGNDGRMLFNDLIVEIRKIIKWPSVSLKLKIRANDVRRLNASYVKYFDSLLRNVSSKILVIRADLSYVREFKSSTSIEQAKIDLKHLFNNMRGKPNIFRDCVGYIWKLEFGLRRGYHFHTIWFFNGHHVHRGAYYCDLIGKYWSDVITRGRGWYYNCNRNINGYKSVGIGMIDYVDIDKRDIFCKKVIGYLTKSEQYLMVRVPRGLKTIDRKVMPKRRTTAVGRRRVFLG